MAHKEDTGVGASTVALGAANPASPANAASHGMSIGDDIHKHLVSIGFPPPSLADNADVVAHLVEMINRIYVGDEDGIWGPGFERTNRAETVQAIRSRELALALRGTGDGDRTIPAEAWATAAPGDVVGCVRTEIMSPTLGEFGMLICDNGARGTGVGRRLLLFAEDHCRRAGCTTIQLELLVPTTWRHAFKERLHGWYARLGYAVVRLTDLDEVAPHLVPFLRTPCAIRIYHKDLLGRLDGAASAASAASST